MNISRRIFSLLLPAILVTACGGRSGAEPTADINSVLTAGVGTMVASVFETQTALYTPPVDTSTPAPSPSPDPLEVPSLTTSLASPTATILYYTATLGTVTPSLTPTITGTPDAASLASGCNNLALVVDLSIPGGSIIKPGKGFTKTWKVENNGTCDWKYPYRLTFTGGDQLGGLDSQLLKKTITPGKWTEVSVNLTAPDTTGTYTGYWRLADSDGNLFGATLVVSIKVGTPPANTSTPTLPPTASPTATITITPTQTETVTPTP